MHCSVKKHLIFFCIIMPLSSITSHTSRQPTTAPRFIPLSKNIPKKKIDRPIVTIWIHGSIFFYHRYVMILKRHIRKLLYGSCATVRTELKAADQLHPKSHLCAITNALTHADTEHYSLEHLYVFRWSGKFAMHKRKKASQKLYMALEHIITTYQEKYGVLPFIRIISHSHGCNLALSLAAWQDQSNFQIDELILLACPVQQQSIVYAQSPLFKKVYNFFSQADWLQKLAIEWKTISNACFSTRTFPVHPHIRQVQVTINNRLLWHYHFRTLDFLHKLPTIINNIDYIFDTVPDAHRFIWNINKPT